jgi:hypothetical protein
MAAAMPRVAHAPAVVTGSSDAGAAAGRTGQGSGAASGQQTDMPAASSVDMVLGQVAGDAAVSDGVAAAPAPTAVTVDLSVIATPLVQAKYAALRRQECIVYGMDATSAFSKDYQDLFVMIGLDRLGNPIPLGAMVRLVLNTDPVTKRRFNARLPEGQLIRDIQHMWRSLEERGMPLPDVSAARGGGDTV